MILGIGFRTEETFSNLATDWLDLATLSTFR